MKCTPPTRKSLEENLITCLSNVSQVMRSDGWEFSVHRRCLLLGKRFARSGFQMRQAIVCKIPIVK